MDKDALQAINNIDLLTRDLDPDERFRLLLQAEAFVSVWLKNAARDLAAAESWQTVGERAGVKRQSAWERWH